MGMSSAHQSRGSAVPAQIKNERDEAQQPPNTSANQHSSVRRTTPDISVVGGNQDADQLAHALIIVNCACLCCQGDERAEVPGKK